MKLIIVLDIDGVDPTRADPHDVAEAVEVDPTGDTQFVRKTSAFDASEARCVFVSAEWES